jgi:hypothetical protein
MTASRGSWLTEAAILFFCWSFLSLLVRIWVKITRRDKWGLDDSTITGGFVSTTIPIPVMGITLTMAQAICILHIGFIFWAISDGYGRPLDSPELKIHLAGKVELPEETRSMKLHREEVATLSSGRVSVKWE